MQWAQKHFAIDTGAFAPFQSDFELVSEDQEKTTLM